MCDDRVMTPGMNQGTLNLSNVLQRTRMSLDGAWNVIVDPYEMGYIGILGDRNDRGFFRDHAPRHPGDRVEYDFDTSPTLTVPGDWNTQDERLHYYEGTIWYRRKVSVTAEQVATGRVFLHIGAANHTSRVFLDGGELSTHAGGFSPYAVELTGKLDAGEHSLVIQVDNRREPDRIPAMRSDWWNFGGLTRSVDLVFVPDTFLQHAWLTMAPDGRVIGGIEVNGGESDVRLHIPSLDVDTTVSCDFELDVDPERWNPGVPVLHDIEWACGDDTITDKVGFRTVETEGTDIVVNGKRTFLHGISRHRRAASGRILLNTPQRCSVGHKTSVRTSSGSPIISTTSTWSARPTAVACWPGANFPCTGALPLTVPTYWRTPRNSSRSWWFVTAAAPQ